jgi:hypothetical protein
MRIALFHKRRKVRSGGGQRCKGDVNQQEETALHKPAYWIRKFRAATAKVHFNLMRMAASVDTYLWTKYFPSQKTPDFP